MPFFKSAAEKNSCVLLLKLIHFNHIRTSHSATEGDPFSNLPLTKSLFLYINKKPGLK